MGIRQDTIDSLKDYDFTKIDGQPTDEDLNLLTEECINAASSIPTTNGGGRHGHIGMIIPEAEYITFLHNAERFVEPTNPGPYPANVDPDPVVRERWPIVGRFKAHDGQLGCYMIPIAGTTNSGIRFFEWTQRFVCHLAMDGHCEGWAFKHKDGTRAKTAQYMEDINDWKQFK
jgi:hypothetical protein